MTSFGLVGLDLQYLKHEITPIQQITWSTTLFRSSLRCVVRDFDQRTSTTIFTSDTCHDKNRSFLRCEACKNGHIYNSPADALQHLHDVHFECSSRKLKERLHDDHCSVWIANASPGLSEDSEMIKYAEQFADQITEIFGMLNEIKWLFASTDTAGVWRRHTTWPRLPRDLVDAFETLLCLYVLTAKQLSLFNRLSAPGFHSRRDRERLRRLEDYCPQVYVQVKSLLSLVKTDILINENVDGGDDTLGIQAIGARFLIAALATTVQNRGTPSSREITSKTTTRATPQFMEMYEKCKHNIQFQMSRRPQKRGFVTIHHLEEELRALCCVVDSQRYILLQCLTADKKVLAHEPGRPEIEYTMKQVARLESRTREVERLQKEIAALKLRVGQTIDVLEEDHGKAIRVFTVVTLFFLPLSVFASRLNKFCGAASSRMTPFVCSIMLIYLQQAGPSSRVLWA